MVVIVGSLEVVGSEIEIVYRYAETLKHERN